MPRWLKLNPRRLRSCTAHTVFRKTRKTWAWRCLAAAVLYRGRDRKPKQIFSFSLSLSAEYISITLKRSHIHMFIIPVDDADYAFLTVSARACLSVNNIARKVVDDLEQFSASMDYGTVKKRLDCERSRPRG